MDQKTHDKGLEIRKRCSARPMSTTRSRTPTASTSRFQELVTEYCWGAVWGREELPRQDPQHAQPRHDLDPEPAARMKAHIKGALTNGVSRDEIREIFMQVRIYAGMPAGVDSFRIAREVFAELDKAYEAPKPSSESNAPVSARRKTIMEIGFIGLGKWASRWRAA
jgi:4-carboxymuconolactone decarboxylase